MLFFLPLLCDFAADFPPFPFAFAIFRSSHFVGYADVGGTTPLLPEEMQTACQTGKLPEGVPVRCCNKLAYMPVRVQGGPARAGDE